MIDYAFLIMYALLFGISAGITYARPTGIGVGSTGFTFVLVLNFIFN